MWRECGTRGRSTKRGAAGDSRRQTVGAYSHAAATSGFHLRLKKRTFSWMRTPKQTSKQEAKYKYYAGFAGSFVDDVLDRYATKGSRVLDPWNGSGTTTSACANRGISSVGMEINPAMLPVSWARLASRDQTFALCGETESLRTSQLADDAPSESDDLLTVFFTERTAESFRGLRQKLILVAEKSAADSGSFEARAVAGVAFLILAEVLRESLRPLRGTNPSWYSRPRKGKAKIDLDATSIQHLLSRSTSAMKESALAKTGEREPDHVWPELLLGDSRADLASLGSFDLVIGSPPYCTRIDYAVATTPEILALGGIGERSFAALRHNIMGSAITDPCILLADDGRHGPLLKTTLELIQNHPSKAASTYYLRYFFRYFEDLLRSLDQIAQVVKDGQIVLVVQNSYFKNIEVNLRAIVVEHLGSRGFELASSWSHEARSPIAWSNPRFKLYRSTNISAEDVLVFNVRTPT